MLKCPKPATTVTSSWSGELPNPNKRRNLTWAGNIGPKPSGGFERCIWSGLRHSPIPPKGILLTVTRSRKHRFSMSRCFHRDGSPGRSHLRDSRRFWHLTVYKRTIVVTVVHPSFECLQFPMKSLHFVLTTLEQSKKTFRQKDMINHLCTNTSGNNPGNSA